MDCPETQCCGVSVEPPHVSEMASAASPTRAKIGPSLIGLAYTAGSVWMTVIRDSLATVKTTAKARAVRSPVELGPGLHPGRIESVLAGTKKRAYRVKLAGGASIKASLGAAVVPGFADECLREGRTVVLIDGESGVEIAGALQVSSSIAPDAKGTLAIDAKHVRLRAAETLELEAPGGRIALEPNGAVRFEGDRLVIDMAALVRIFSSKVELP